MLLFRPWRRQGKITAVPGKWNEVLEVAGFNANVRTVLTDVDRENLTFADMEGGTMTRLMTPSEVPSKHQGTGATDCSRGGAKSG
jgi:hypothetical protein